jgi:glucokinase
VALNASALVIGVDIGGTKVLGGEVEADGTVLSRVRRETPHHSLAPSVVEDTIVEVVTELAAGRPVATVGVGAAGFVDPAGELVRFSPHLSWREEPLRQAISERLALPVLVDNDANTTAWAEVRFGAARGRRQVLCLTLGTGIGGALVIDGRLFRGANGMAGEFGHMQVVPDGRLCECGNRGCWEQYASGARVVREAGELLATGSPAAFALAEATQGEPARLTGPLVTEVARAGDRTAAELIAQVGDWLGVGLAGLCAGFDPELVVIGGGLSDAGDLLLEPARRALARTLTGRGFRPEPPIVRAELGTDAGFVGAAELARAMPAETLRRDTGA